MPIKPKLGYARSVHKANQEVIVKFCENPLCGTKLSREKAREGAKYCDRLCWQEHSTIRKRERRPAQVLCEFCGNKVDTMRAAPSYWEQSEVFFCDQICGDGYRRRTGQYQDMSKSGNEKAAAYKDKHKQVINHKGRSEAVSKNNRERPPKAKHFIREGRAWGYDVKFYPHEDGDKYRVSVPELGEELGSMTAKTVKEGLKMVRERIVEIRINEAKQGGNDA